MTYKEFNDWCNDRVYDSMWGIKEAMYCASICSDISNYSRFCFKREKKWKNDERRETAEKIVAETNKLIDKLKKRRKGEAQEDGRRP